MSELEESLLDSDEEEAPTPKKQNNPVPQLRDQLKARETELEALKTRNAQYEEVFLQQSGLSEKQAQVLRAGGYEVTPSGIESFRAEVLGVVEQPKAEEPTTDVQAEEAVEEPEQKAPFTPTAGGVSPAGKRTVTTDELNELLRTDPIKADKILRDGRVERQQFNPGGPAF